MGADVELWIKARDGEIRTKYSRVGFTLEARDPGNDWGGIPEGATHEVLLNGRVVERYYSPAYPRGDMPTIAAVIMQLLTSPDVEKVWYFSDYYHDAERKEMTPCRLLAYVAHYLEHGTRKYHGEWDAKPRP